MPAVAIRATQADGVARMHGAAVHWVVTGDTTGGALFGFFEGVAQAGGCLIVLWRNCRRDEFRSGKAWNQDEGRQRHNCQHR